MSRVPYTAEQLKKLGLVEHNGSYVPVKSLVQKGKVEKLPSLIERAIGYQKDIDESHIKMKLISEKTGYRDLLEMESKVTVHYPKLIDEMLEVAKYYSSKIMAELTTVKIKPLTQNRAWKGRRLKSDQYKVYARAVSLLLPNNLIVPDGLLRVYYEFGMSTNSDFDNPCKMFTDILQSKYGFNDSRIMEARIRKVIVKKGNEYIKFKIESL